MISGTGFLAVAAREAATNTRKEAQKEIDSLKIVAKKAKEEVRKIAQLKTRLTVLHGWHREVALDLIADMAGTTLNEVRQLIAAFEKVKTYCLSHPEQDVKIVTQLSGLNEGEIKALLTLLAAGKV